MAIDDDDLGYDPRVRPAFDGPALGRLETADGEGVDFQRVNGVPVFRARAPMFGADPGLDPMLAAQSMMPRHGRLSEEPEDSWLAARNRLIRSGDEDGPMHGHRHGRPGSLDAREEEFSEPDPEEYLAEVERARGAVATVVTLCERRLFTFTDGSADIVVTRLLPCCEWPDVVLQVLVHDLTLTSDAAVRVRAYAAAPNVEDEEVLVDPTPIATATLAVGSAAGSMVSFGLVPGRIGEGISVRVDGNPPTLAPAATSARLTIQAVMRTQAPPRPILDGNTTVYGSLQVSDGSKAASLTLDRSASTDAVIEWREANVLRWRLYNRSSDGDLKLERYDSSGVLQDVPLSIEASTGRVRGKLPYVTMTGYDLTSGHARRFIVFAGTGSNSTLSDGNNNSNWVVPHAGRLLKVTVLTSANSGSTSVCFHKNLDTSVDSSREVVASVGVTTAVDFDFSSKTVSFSSGDRVSISVDTTNTPNDVNVTCLWELEY